MSYLTSDLKSDYDRDGAVVIRNVFDESWLAIVESAIEQNKGSPSQYGETVRGDSGQGSYFNDYLNWQNIPGLKEYVYHSPAAKIAKFLTGSRDIVFYHEHVLCKEPQTGKNTPWHHDQAYYPLHGDQVCSLWMPVDHVARAETLLFIRGSHKLGYFMPYKFATERPYPISNTELHAQLQFSELPGDVTSLGDVIGWEVSRGDCVVFAGRTLHGAPPNLSDRQRRVLSTRWVGDDVTCARRPWVCSPPVTGNLQPGDKFQEDGLFPVINC